MKYSVIATKKFEQLIQAETSKHCMQMFILR